MSRLWLIPISGPSLQPIELNPRPEGLTIGRHEKCDLMLPSNAEQVSRMHARLMHDETEGWRLSDLGSRWGTFLNGVKLTPKLEIPIKPGDLIGIAPWTFTVSTSHRIRGLQPKEDMGQTVVRAISEKNARPLAENLLQLLLESAAKIHASTSENELAENVISAALRGTGLSNGVMLKPVDGLNSFNVISSQISKDAQNSPSTFSRSLLLEASGGNVAEISAGSGGDFSQSLVQMNVSAAICAPLMLGESAAAFLYLDSRGSIMQAIRPNASEFCVALSKIASLALANIKRVEIEKRQSSIDAELSAAAAAQKWIMPKRLLQFGDLKTIGESKPGQQVGGDFFDIIPLADGKLAIAVGDVSGKGVSASVLMTATQGYLHASLDQYHEPGKAVTALNRFIGPRRPASRFVTLWVGLIDPKNNRLTYVDAAHGYAVLRKSDGTMHELNDGGGLPVGVMDDSEYTAIEVEFAKGDQLVIVSDGIIEQPSRDSSIESRQEFEIEGVKKALAITTDDIVKLIFTSVFDHAGTEQLADDATTVWVGW